MPRLWLSLACVLVFVLAWTQFSSLEPRRETGTLQIKPPTPYIHYSPAPTSRGRVLVVHGLDASKETMQLLSAALTDGGFEVFAIDLPGHGDSRAGFDASFAEQAIGNVFAHLGEDTLVLGHSLGAGLLLDLAEDRHFSKMILLSPPPVPVSRIQADRVLLVSGALDVARIRAFAPIVADIGSSQIEWWTLTWAAHSSAIFNPIHVRRIVEWAGGDGGRTRTLARFVWIGLMLISTVTFGTSVLPRREKLPERKVKADSATRLIVRYVAACSGAIMILRIFNPLSWLRFFATDYLIAFVFLTGVVLWVSVVGERPSLQLNSTALLKAAAAAAFVIFVIGFLVASNILHMVLTDGRWWRFPFVVAAGLPLLAFDEFTIRQLDSRRKALLFALVSRLLLWAFLLTGVLILNRQAAFLILIAHLIVAFWMGLWLAISVVHRHTRDPLASALFGAIVQGWAFAAWFVTI